MISVVDYGSANIGSILNMLRKLKARVEVVSTSAAIEQAEKIILPGVGAFDHGVTMLSKRGMIDPLKRKAREDGVPILGICLGMQLLGRSSEEGYLDGLGLINGRCLRFRFEGKNQLKVPHMGWNELLIKRNNVLLHGFEDPPRFYFVHSYFLECFDLEDVIATSIYGIEFAAAINKNKIWGVQFHPEKSHKFGMRVMRNFCEL